MSKKKLKAFSLKCLEEALEVFDALGSRVGEAGRKK